MARRALLFLWAPARERRPGRCKTKEKQGNGEISRYYLWKGTHSTGNVTVLKWMVDSVLKCMVDS